MNHGLRNGGGVGDILRKPSKDVSNRALPLGLSQAAAGLPSMWTIPPPCVNAPSFPYSASFCNTVQSYRLPTPAHLGSLWTRDTLATLVLALRLGKV